MSSLRLDDPFYSKNTSFCPYQIVQILRQSPLFFSLFFLHSARLVHNFFIYFARCTSCLVLGIAKSQLHKHTVHIHVLNILSSNTDRSNIMASFTNSSICLFSKSSSKLFNTSAHSILDLISDVFIILPESRQIRMRHNKKNTLCLTLKWHTCTLGFLNTAASGNNATLARKFLSVLSQFYLLL